MTTKTDILIAEDNDFVRLQIVKFLEDEGYNTIEAVNGEEAHSIIKDQDVDLAVVDVKMEPMSGFDFIRSIHGMNKSIPVILVTGDNNPDMLSQAGELKINAILTKPVNKDRLVQAVQRTLAAKQRNAS